MAGANLSFKISSQLWHRALRLLQWGANRGPRAGVGRMCVKAGAPVTNTAADDPGQVGVLCLDETNDDVYICTAYTSATVHTWVKITP